MNLKSIFDVFSRRNRDANKPLKPLTQAFRTRVLMLCRDRFSPGDREFDRGDYRQELWADIHRRMTYLVGRPRLTNHPQVESEIEDVLQFLSTCSDEHFLDFVEYIFQVDCYLRACRDENAMVEEVNQMLRLEDLPYAVTPFVRKTADYIVACYDDTGYYFDSLAYGIQASKSTVESPLFLIGLLNSKYLNRVHDQLSQNKDKVFAKVLAENLKKLPLPILDFSNSADRTRHDKLVGLVEKMLALTPKLRGATSESEKATLQNAVTTTDAEIDRLVYELYGLTEEEIKIVEGEC